MMSNKFVALTKETFYHWYKHSASRMGAAISFYALFSVAPFFILVISLVRTIFNKTVVDTTIANGLRVTIGTNLGNSVENLINSTYYSHTGLVAAIVSGIVLIIAAVSVFSELNSDLDELWALPSQKEKVETPVRTILLYIKDKLIALGLILLFGLLLLFSVALTVLISFLHVPISGFFENSLLIQSILSIIMDSVLFVLIYRILPDTKLPWKEIVTGAIITAILFLFGKFLISWYVDEFSGASAFGTASSIVGLLLWIYYSAQVFFIGASYTFVYSRQYGFLSKRRRV